MRTSEIVRGDGFAVLEMRGGTFVADDLIWPTEAGGRGESGLTGECAPAMERTNERTYGRTDGL